MAKDIREVFKDNPTVEIIELVDIDDKGPYGLSPDRHKLKIFDDSGSPATFAKLPGANTPKGYISPDGYVICGGYLIQLGGNKIFIYRNKEIFHKLK